MIICVLKKGGGEGNNNGNKLSLWMFCVYMLFKRKVKVYKKIVFIGKKGDFNIKDLL